MKILIINQPLGNRGDESAHKALVRTLLQKVDNIQIRVLFVGSVEQWSISQFKIDDKRVKYLNIHTFFRASKFSDAALLKPIRKIMWDIHPSLYQIKREYKWADIVLCAPGGICMGGFQNWQHLYFLKLAKHFKKPLAYYGRSFGPFPISTELNRKYKEISYEMLNYFSFLSIRDSKTAKLADEIGVSYTSTLDTAFLETPCVEIPYEIKMQLRNKSYMVFVPNYLLWHYAYRGKFTESELIDFYCRVVGLIWKFNPDLHIVMLPQVYGKGDKIDDLPLFRMIANQINDPRIIIISDSYNSDIQQTIIRSAQFVIGARYHSIVFAINQCVPFIALSYEHKIAGLLETLGKEDSMINFTETMFSAEAQEECLLKLYSMMPLLKNDINARNKAKQITQEGLEQFLIKINK